MNRFSCTCRIGICLAAFLICLVSAEAMEKNGLRANGEKAAAPEGVAFFPCWSPDGNWIAFSLHGNIWKVPAAGGKASPLTFQEDVTDIKPRWSPDGMSIAFTSNRSGNFDVWTVPSQGGRPSQITFHTMWDSVSDWTPDGEWLVFYSYRSGRMELWKIRSKGGIAVPITSFGGKDGMCAPDGACFVYAWGDSAFWQRGYLGSSNWEIYTVSAAEDRSCRRLTDYEGNDIYPSYSPDGRHVYFLREQEIPGKDGAKSAPVYNLWKMTASGQGVEQLTFFASDMYAPQFSRDGKQVVFEKDFGIWRMQLEGGKAEPLAIEVSADLKSEQKIVRTLSEGSEGGCWSPDGREIAFGLDGDIWIMPASGGKARRAIFGKSKEEWPRFSPSGRYIAYCSDKSGNSDIYLRDLEKNEDQKLVEHESEDFYHSWSPDGKYLLFTSERSGNRDIWIVPKFGGPARQLTDSPLSEDDAVFSPDGQWIAFDSGKSGNQEIWVMPFDKGYAEAKMLTSHGSLSQVPTWSPDGRRIAYEVNDSQGKASIWIISHDGGEPMQLVANGSLPMWSPDGKSILFESERDEEKKLYCVRAPEEVHVGRAIPFLAEVEVNLAEERRQVFEEAWQAISLGFYDSEFHGVDWQKVKDRYAPLVEETRTDAELEVLLNRMSGELRSSHTGMSGLARKCDAETAYLGLEVEQARGSKGVRVASVLREGPADRVWIRPGDFLFRIGDELVTIDTDISRQLAGKEGKKVKLFVSPSGNPEEGRYVEPIPVGLREIQAIEYRHWLMLRIDLVRRRCQGKVLYIHLTEMDAVNLTRFQQIVRETVERAEGMILDVRNNGGGMIHQELLEILVGRPYVAFQARGQKERRYQPLVYWDRPVVVLVNERSFSDAEVFAYAFQHLKRGKVVGVPTSGGVIGTADIRLSNRGTFRVPRVGYYSTDGKNLEGAGVVPDILVSESPDDRTDGRDPQLLRAAQVVLEEIARSQAPQEAEEPPASPSSEPETPEKSGD